jgi:hypothetical protein
MQMNLMRIALASLGGTVAYFAYGFAMFAAWPSMKSEFKKYPNVYRSEASMMKVMPFGMVGILISIVVVAILYAKIYSGGGDIESGLLSGISLGALIGLFVVCVFAIHNYVNLNIGVKLTVYQSIAYFFQWIVVVAAVGLIYKPS